jgi:hypothetical protein
MPKYVIAPDEHSVREHAERGGFPADRISEATSIIDPTTRIESAIGAVPTARSPYKA